jgi:hypothetical protein
LSDDGVQVRWTAPTNSFLQFGMEGLSGEKFPAMPTHDGVGAQSVFVKAGGDVNVSNSWLASLAYYHADAEELMTGDDSFTGETHLGIAGVVWKWAPDGNFVECFEQARNFANLPFLFRHVAVIPDAHRRGDGFGGSADPAAAGGAQKVKISVFLRLKIHAQDVARAVNTNESGRYSSAQVAAGQ